MNKKLKFLFTIFTFLLFTTSCNQVEIDSEVLIDSEKFENQVVKQFYEKKENSKFLNFLKNADENVRAYRSSVPSFDEKELTEEEIFARVWESLSDEEKSNFQNNADEIDFSMGAFLAVDKESDLGRAALSGDSSNLEQAAAMYGFLYKLNDLFKGQTISSNFLPEEIKTEEEYEIPVAQLMEYCIQTEQWDIVETVLKSIKSSITVKELKKEFKKLNSILLDSPTETRASIITGYKENALIDNIGKELKTGTVLLTCPKKKAFFIVGKWQHAGIFSFMDYKLDLGDASHCVYTAQPDNYDDFPEDMKPDRPGYACLDTIYMYTRQKRFATLLPKKYSEVKGKSAVMKAKTIYYDEKPKYLLPFWEMFTFFDTSHDETSRNTYCSKVVYTAWKKIGVNLDGRTFAGNLVSPDDLYGSAFDRYYVIRISFFKWSYTWKWKTYSATSDVILKLSQ